VQDEALRIGRPKAARVPHRVMKIRPADPGKRRLVGKRHQDGAVEVRFVEREAPLAVEVDPFAPT